jgi:hypothetical protein
MQHVEELRNAYKILVGRLKRPIGIIHVGRITLR